MWWVSTLSFIGVTAALVVTLRTNHKLLKAVRRQKAVIDEQDEAIRRFNANTVAHRFTEEQMIAVIEPVHPTFKGTKIPKRVVAALIEAGVLSEAEFI